MPRNFRLRAVPDKPEPAEPAQPEIPSPPSWLDQDAAAIWHNVVELMVAARTWRPDFSDHLGAYCALMAEFRKDPRAFGATRLAQLRLYSGDLGLSPSHFDRVKRS